VTRTFTLVVRRELLLALRRKGDVLNVLVFFVVVASLFPLGVGPEPNQLRAMAAGVAWIAALLAAVLSLPRLFAGDYADGTLEQMLVSPAPLAVVVLAKTAAHWLLTGLPLALVAPLIGLQYDLPAAALWILLLSLLIGTPVLSLIGAAGAALTLGVRGGGALLALLVLPLYVPVLVFGAGAVTASLTGINPSAHLSLLGASLAVSSVVGPWAACAALRVALD
jgi:heme exporter protein B